MGFLSGFRAYYAGKKITQTAEREPPPLRSEIFSAYQMGQHGADLASRHVLAENHATGALLPRLSENEAAIIETCRMIAEAVSRKRQITPASEWLIDNLPLIEEHIGLAKKHLPKGYSKGLPVLKKENGEKGVPRVYDLATEVIAHGDGRIELESLSFFLTSYQEKVTLLLGELWAVPIMFRLALIENLRRVANSIALSRVSKDLAAHWAERMIEAADRDPKSLVIVLADMVRSQPPVEPAFVAELVRLLQGQKTAMSLPLGWIEQRLEEEGTTTEKVVHAELQSQALDQVSVSNSIASLRLLDDINWQDFVEAHSVVENILRTDPSGDYAAMDFTTRDQYRHRLENVAKRSGQAESEIASVARALASEGAQDGRRNHVGYYLIGNGAEALERRIGYRGDIADRFRKSLSARPLAFYLGAIFLITADVIYTLVNKAADDGTAVWFLIPLGIACAFGASQLAVAMVNWFATVFSKPGRLPRLDYSKGIPDDKKTLVVVPTMLSGVSGIDALCDLLEVRSLANRDPNLHFCLLTDFKDSQNETGPGDTALLSRATQNIERLNRLYAPEEKNRFFLFHRPRRWNAGEHVWMGYERKRGKLSDLNKFLLTGDSSAFSAIVGNTASLRDIRYVFTLDSDTQLPRDVASQCVSAMAHPLNRPYIDEDTRCVVEGYALLQPRIASSLPGNDDSLYARLCGGEPGIDPYTRTVSDIYQDAFEEGSFIGKGIYDVAAFEHALHERFPENRILSHDLLEGCFTRSGLLSDIQLYEGYPVTYGEDVARRHRWIRGDWQIASWALPTIKNRDGRKYRNPLSALSRWKIIDNIRRSLVPQSLLFLLVYGLFFSGSPVFWLSAVLALVFIPSLYAVIFDLAHKSPDVTTSQHLSFTLKGAGRHFGNAAFSFVTIPYEAWYSTDAIARTVWRLAVSRKNLLEWTPSGDPSLKRGNNPAALYRRMWLGPVLGLLSLIFLTVTGDDIIVLLSSGIVALAWLSSPAIVWILSRKRQDATVGLNHDEVQFLGKVSRKIWEFFDRFVGPDDNWLPPDNHQEMPVAVTAHRTSPTNMGLSLLANLTAGDFGYIPAGIAVRRTNQTISTMARLERYRGHFYNWYDTKSLLPLLPTYVSSVDSSNLAGHLLVLKSGLLQMVDEPIVSPRLKGGVADTIAVLEESLGQSRKSVLSELKALVEGKTECATPGEAVLFLESVIVQGEGIFARIERGNDAAAWLSALIRQCRDHLEDILWIAPWASLEEAQSSGIPNLRTLASWQSGTLSHESGEVAAQKRISSSRAMERIGVLTSLAAQAASMAEMEYDFLFDANKKLLAIGYHVAERRVDTGFYDLLASEARLGYFVTIAQNILPQESWFALSRQLKGSALHPALVSWSGSMFEYLMPNLVMPSFPETLLDQTCKAAVRRQIEYGKSRDVPWGISESGYYMFDASLNYQYRAFGVPGLGMKRDLADDLVIAPYASVMALMVAPREACDNMRRMSAEGFESRYGYYEAVDYTQSRIPRGKKFAVVQSFMVHHQGMAFLSLSHALLGRPMQNRFAAEPLFKSAMLLLHEKIPRAVRSPADDAKLPRFESLSAAEQATPSVRIFDTPDTETPQINLLSNGTYHLSVSNAGGSHARWKNLSVTRWREDITKDNWGAYCYIRDVSSGAVWSAAHQPVLKKPDHYEVIFSEGRAEYRRRDGHIHTHMEVVVSPEDDIELRRVKITNRASSSRTIDVTSFSEVVLAPFAADAAHPAFSNLFVMTEILHKRRSIMATRRPRSFGETPPWMFHLMAPHGADVVDMSYDSSRLGFMGRGRTAQSPQSVYGDAPLGGSEGPVLDPVAAIKARIVLAPEQTVTIDIVTGVCAEKTGCEALIDKYQDEHITSRVLEMSWTHGQVILRQLNCTEADAQLYSRIASAVVHPHASTRALPSTIMRNTRTQSGLWSYAISGDLPIVLLRIANGAHIELVRQMVQAHAYWRLKGLSVDLVIWNEDTGGYRDNLQERIFGIIGAGTEGHLVDKPGGIFVRSTEHIPDEDKVLMESVACIVLSDAKGTLEEQIAKASQAVKKTKPPTLQRRLPPHQRSAPQMILPENLALDNGYGGFSEDGSEYVIVTDEGRTTPMPWSNVIANPQVGTVISERGQGYTWFGNANQFRLTPWGNDPVSDVCGEAFFIRDEETAQYWSPVPDSSEEPCITRHGYGYSVFERIVDGIQTEMTVFTPVDAPMKVTRLAIRNLSGRPRKISATGYVDWVLGDLRHKHAMHVVTEQEPKTGAVLARNAYNMEFRDVTAFFGCGAADTTVTADRREFIGRNRSLKNPVAMEQAGLPGRTGAALDPCAAIQTVFDLSDQKTQDIVFVLGATRGGAEDASRIVKSCDTAQKADAALREVRDQWATLLTTVQIETPDPALNILANGWLLYQTIGCRLWARSGYYQSGGAYGFRDQLQDAMATVHTDPSLLRKQLFLHAAHQFPEGDVQHWWHPPSDRGVRTRCSDDYLWMPLAAHRYVSITGDVSVFDEEVHFIEGRALNPGEESYYDLPTRSDRKESFYRHCVLALEYGMRYGEHGLPLIGSCDWNDGMDRVGEHGKGESVWLGFFLYDLLLKFAPIAEARGDGAFALKCLEQARLLKENIARHGWDGDWYRRAYFDDGTPLGSAQNAECSIDSLSQSWAVLSGAGDADRCEKGMAAADARLVNRKDRLIQLLDPPFDKSDLNPGYIRGYVPGVRENGGQYTHAAIWMAMAFAKMGKGDKAFELLQMINPLNHARTREEADLYKVEPYVITADVYGVPPHTGRGGWSWYTGSSGWFYRLMVESILGLVIENGRLRLLPVIPSEWNGFKMAYRYGTTVYEIEVVRREGGRLILDGVTQDRDNIALTDDGQVHSVVLEIKK